MGYRIQYLHFPWEEIDPSTGDAGPPTPAAQTRPALKIDLPATHTFLYYPQLAHPSRIHVLHSHESTTKHTLRTAFRLFMVPWVNPTLTHNNKLHSPRLSPCVSKVLATVPFISFLFCRLSSSPSNTSCHPPHLHSLPLP